MTKTIAETRVRAQMQEYDGMHRVIIECRETVEWTWSTVAVFSDGCCEEHAKNQAREAGWSWLVGADLS